MNQGATPLNSASAYYLAVTAEDARLAAVLSSIRADVEAGEVSMREAADNRIEALEDHLRRCRELRQQYFGTS